MYLIDDGAKRYVRSYGGNHLDVFPKKDRKSLASQYVEEFEEIYKNAAHSSIGRVKNVKTINSRLFTI